MVWYVLGSSRSPRRESIGPSPGLGAGVAHRFWRLRAGRAVASLRWTVRESMVVVVRLDVQKFWRGGIGMGQGRAEWQAADGQIRQDRDWKLSH